MTGVIYFYRTYTATWSGSVKRRERCAECSNLFEYEVHRTANGGGHSAFFLNNTGAAAAAKRRARENLARALADAVEPVHCPTCGIYQPRMVAVLSRRFGRGFAANEYAGARVRIPLAEAWRHVTELDTPEGYQKFMQVWPAEWRRAEVRLREVKHRGLWKVLSHTFSFVWAPIACAALALIAMALFGR
jgi:hypothetical protein